jgi:hypothetical protein
VGEGRGVWVKHVLLVSSPGNTGYSASFKKDGITPPYPNIAHFEAHFVNHGAFWPIDGQ